MARAFYIISFLIVTHFNVFAQNSINNYKYIIVPNQYEFLKEKDLYQINSLTKFLFNKYGYSAYMQDEDLPMDLGNNRCLGLIVNVVKESGFLKTKLRIDLNDCNGNLVQSSKVGETREKEFSKAYNLALRDAFETFQNMNYTYQPNDKIVSQGASTTTITNGKDQEEITRLKEEIKVLKEEKVENVEDKLPGVESKKLEELLATVNDSKELKSEVLYAQAIDNGFQIVDRTPKVVMVLLPTGAKDVFAVKDKNAVVYKKNELWIYSENDGTSVNETTLNIKF